MPVSTLRAVSKASCHCTRMCVLPARCNSDFSRGTWERGMHTTEGKNGLTYFSFSFIHSDTKFLENPQRFRCRYPCVVPAGDKPTPIRSSRRSFLLFLFSFFLFSFSFLFLSFNFSRFWGVFTSTFSQNQSRPPDVIPIMPLTNQRNLGGPVE